MEVGVEVLVMICVVVVDPVGFVVGAVVVVVLTGPVFVIGAAKFELVAIAPPKLLAAELLVKVGATAAEELTFKSH